MILNVEFHLLPDKTLENSLRRVCALVEKNFSFGQKIYLYSNNISIIENLNNLLWTFHDTGFLPHEIYNGNINFQNVPILIGDDPNFKFSGDLLFNLSEEIPTFCKEFKKIIEVVPAEENLRACARNRYKYYKSQGYTLQLYQ